MRRFQILARSHGKKDTAPSRSASRRKTRSSTTSPIRQSTTRRKISNLNCFDYFVYTASSSMSATSSNDRSFGPSGRNQETTNCSTGCASLHPWLQPCAPLGLNKRNDSHTTFKTLIVENLHARRD